MQTVINNWKIYLQTRAFRNEFALTCFAFFVSGSQNIHFIAEFEKRQGMRLNDFVLNMLPPIDLSTPIFLITYSTVFFVLIELLSAPDRLAKGLQMFALLSFLRTLTIYLVPLEAPADIIFLNDPFANILLHQPDLKVVKDLFFSGHTATIALMFFLTKIKWIRIYCGIALIVSPAFILLQHVHYTIDIIAAIPAAYFCYRLVNWLHTQRNPKWQAQTT
jgi:hypothetical protein